MQHDMMNITWSSFNYGLVTLSYIIASLGAFAALEFIAHMRTAQGTLRRVWLVGGAVLMAVGIWSMHFVGMLALRMDMSISYHPLKTVLSIVFAVVACLIAFVSVSGKTTSILKIVGGGFSAGAGVVGMHYMGMAAMQLSGSVHYKPGWFALSCVIAVVAATAAIWIFAQIGQLAERGGSTGMLLSLQIIAALVMGVAVIAMHYTGMAATVFTFQEGGANLGVSNQQLVSIVTIGSFAILFIAIFISMFIRISSDASRSTTVTSWQ
jgi:diguanylate cyclase